MTKQKEGAPTTMAEVAEMTSRLEALGAKEAALAIKEEGLAAEIADAHVHGLDQKALDLLTYNRREAKEDREDVSEAIPLLQARIAEDREAASKAEGERRMRGIGKAFGSLRQELDEDERKVHEAATVYRDAVNRVNARYKALAMLRAEAGALADRFGVAAPIFTAVVIPALREGCREAAMTAETVAFLNHAHVATAMEEDADGIRSRRSYREVSGTPGGAIIKTAGSQPWAPLTEAQQKVLDGRKRDRQEEIRASKRFATESERALQRSGILGGAGGR